MIRVNLLAAEPVRAKAPLFSGVGANKLHIIGVAMVATKALIVTGLGRLFCLPLGVSLQAGLLLGPGSEFTFVIIGLATHLELLTPDIAALALAVAATTMTLVPVLERIGAWTERRLPVQPVAEVNITPLPDVAPVESRVIVCGCPNPKCGGCHTNDTTSTMPTPAERSVVLGANNDVAKRSKLRRQPYRAGVTGSH